MPKATVENIVKLLKSQLLTDICQDLATKSLEKEEAGDFKEALRLATTAAVLITYC